MAFALAHYFPVDAADALEWAHSICCCCCQLLRFCPFFFCRTLPSSMFGLFIFSQLLFCCPRLAILVFLLPLPMASLWPTIFPVDAADALGWACGIYTSHC